MYLGDYVQECAWESSRNLHIWPQLDCLNNTFSVTVGGGIRDFTYQIILQSMFMTKNYKLKNILKL